MSSIGTVGWRSVGGKNYERSTNSSQQVSEIYKVGGYSILFLPYNEKCLRRSDLTSLSNLSSRFFHSTCSLSDNELLTSIIHKDLPNTVAITFPVVLKAFIVFQCCQKLM